jgi:transketolase
MRNIFLNYLTEQAAIDPNLYLIVGDVGYSVIEKFQERFPQRMINAGVAEQNMVGMAAGLAMAGKNVYVYSIVPFACMRNFEQIRIDICYQNLPVKIVGNGGGFTYAQAGVTHHALEDVAIMRSLPGMTVVSPGSKKEVGDLMPQINALQGPAYLRLANNEELVTYQDQTMCKLGKAIELIPHDEVMIIGTGNGLDLAWETCKALETAGISVGLVSMPTIKPLDSEFFLARHKNLKAVFTIEEHSVIGGLGEATARFVAETMPNKIIFKSFGVQDFYYHTVGSRAYLKKHAGLEGEQIATQIKKLLVDYASSTVMQSSNTGPAITHNHI